MMIETKICSKCETEYPATTEFFPVRKKGYLDGLDSWCRFCHRKSAMLRYERNKQKINERGKSYWQKRYVDRREPKGMNFGKIDALSETELAYIAGLIDGEGSFTLGAVAKTKTITPVIGVCMTHLPTIQWLAGKLDCTITPVKRREPKPHWKPQYAVRLSGKRTIRLALRVQPYMITKRGQVELVIEFGEVGFYYGTKSVENPLGREEIIARREDLRLRMQRLNDNRKHVPVGGEAHEFPVVGPRGGRK